MEPKRTEQSAGIPAVGGELRSLKQHGTATMSELREFVAQMRGKSAREMLGSVAESGLVRATIQATLGCIVLIGVFTVGPYYVWGGKAEAKSAGPAASAQGKSGAAARSPQDDSTTSDTPATADSADSSAKTAKSTKGELPSPDDLDKAAKKLGIGEAKAADPKVNPLDKDLDFLLDKK